MSSRAVHSVAGIGAGAVAAGCCSAELEGWKRAAELIGGAFGGFLGSRVPDILEPATSPNHRKTAHSVLPMSACLSWATKEALSAQIALRRRADSVHQKAVATDGAFLLDQLLILALHFLAGMVAGILAGYASHLALDATTYKGLPLV